MKKLILLLFLLIVPTTVNALSTVFDISKPTLSFDYISAGGIGYHTTLDMPEPYYRIGTLGNFYYSRFLLKYDVFFSERTGFEFRGLSLCDGEPVNVGGSFIVETEERSFSRNAKVWATTNASTKTILCITDFTENDGFLHFSCPFNSLNNNNITFYMTDLNYENVEGFEYSPVIYITKKMDYTCNPGNSAVIDNQNKNKQEIINNQNHNQEETNKRLDESNKQLGDLNNNLTDDKVDGASGSASEFFKGFESNDHGLTSIIKAPLNLINSITSSTCSPIGFQAPFVNQQVELPCMKSIYQNYFGTFLTIYQTITFGIVAYWVSVKIFFMVKEFKNPDSDRIEVLDL